MERKDENLTIDLKDISAGNTAQAGAKAANLGVLASAGFPIPDGFALTVVAFLRFADANHLSADSSPAQVSVGAMPGEVEEALLRSAVRLGDVPLAVRSSGVAEDLAGASFAGQYETVLDVRGKNDLIAAVKRCWASAFDPRVTAYKGAKGILGVPKMALFIQRMVPASAAGVAFTVNPVTGDRDEVIVNAVLGLGERLVSGQVSPDEWRVRDGNAVCMASPEGAIDAAQALSIAEMAKRAERLFGSPQDIEWAIWDNQIHMLQSRPITTQIDAEDGSIPVPVEVPPGFWQRESVHFARPLSPLMRTTYLPAETAGMANMCRTLSFPFEKLDCREIGGWVYQRIVPLGDKGSNPPPDWLMYLLIRLVPAMRSRVKGMARNMRDDMVSTFIDRWYDQWKPGQIERISQLRSVDLPGLSDDGLNAHLEQTASFLNDSMTRHGLVLGIGLANAMLAFTCRDLFGWDDKQTIRLTTGLSLTTSAASVKLAELAEMVRAKPDLLQALEAGYDEQDMPRLAGIYPDFAAAFAAYQQDFGCRAVAFEAALPTIAEMPDLTISLILNQAGTGYDPRADASALARRRDDALREAKALLAGRSASDRQRFERDLKRAQRAYPIHEDHEFYLGQAPLALLRYAVLEAGTRLVRRGCLSVRDDAFCLELSELHDALRGGTDCRPLVRRRRAENHWVTAHPGPGSYGPPIGPPPSGSLFPGDSRMMMEGMVWVFDSTFGLGTGSHCQNEENAIHGIAASAGTYAGPVRIVMDERQFQKIRPGDVLVCPTTSPVWSIVFPGIGALVTDAGGILSHPAIIAREYRVPAVIATGNASRLLHDGQRVLVDGSSGVVKLVV